MHNGIGIRLSLMLNLKIGDVKMTITLKEFNRNRKDIVAVGTRSLERTIDNASYAFNQALNGNFGTMSIVLLLVKWLKRRCAKLLKKKL